jgi:hypothetical protein
MKTVVTTLGSFPTGTEIADAVTGYSLALARARTVDVVDIPFVASNGSHRRVELRIGWLTETAVLSGAPIENEPFEVDTILLLRAKTQQLETRRGVSEQAPSFTNLTPLPRGTGLGRADLTKP